MNTQTRYGPGWIWDFRTASELGYPPVIRWYAPYASSLVSNRQHSISHKLGRNGKKRPGFYFRAASYFRSSLEESRSSATSDHRSTDTLERIAAAPTALSVIRTWNRRTRAGAHAQLSQRKNDRHHNKSYCHELRQSGDLPFHDFSPFSDFPGRSSWR